MIGWRRLLAPATLLLWLAACNIGPGRTAPTPTATLPPTPTQMPLFATATPVPSATSPPPTATPAATFTPVSLPNIAVELPRPGERVVSPLRVAGSARVFEGNVQARLLSATGEELARGATTASAGAPERGRYEMLLEFRAPPGGGTATLEVFSISARDGSPENVVRVPLILEAP